MNLPEMETVARVPHPATPSRSLTDFFRVFSDGCSEAECESESAFVPDLREIMKTMFFSQIGIAILMKISGEKMA